ncbi:hypothetical protein EYR36_006715 [Pleurotus pulmonarius]|nr:hypothetical protein EYR36_006715 [Pleurotus pulmonarius]KAF4601411.1 hypothetical protein EYR38_006064 [Pleurotus pulmonarius]
MLNDLRIQAGKSDPSVVSRILESGNYSPNRCADREVVRDVASAAYAGGAETSHAVLSTFIAAMLLYPDVQAKGQLEIDSCIDARLPNFDDLPHMPYVHAIMLEVLRWQVVLPLSVAHRLTMDDEYNGYYLPKHSTVFVNTWAILQDEEYYPDPDSFKPERFLKDGLVDPKLKDLIVNFGYGRRTCPGRFFAMDSLWISLTSMLAVFNIKKAKNADGQEIDPDIQYIPGYTRHIKPFRCSITPRSPEAERLIRDSDLM